MEKILNSVINLKKKDCISYGGKNFIVLNKQEKLSTRIVLFAMKYLFEQGRKTTALNKLWETVKFLGEKNNMYLGKTTVINTVYKLIPVFLMTTPKQIGSKRYVTARIISLTTAGKIYTGIIKREE